MGCTQPATEPLQFAGRTPPEVGTEGTEGADPSVPVNLLFLINWLKTFDVMKLKCANYRQRWTSDNAIHDGNNGGSATSFICVTTAAV